MEGINDPRELLVCARYEFFRGEPIEKAYENYCTIVGEDAMTYRDFEFWWYRFKEGNFDLDYDRIKNPSKELGDMPVVVMEEILANLEWEERAICRKVSRDVRDVIDNMKFTIEEIWITISDNSISLSFNEEDCIKYKGTDNGCRVEFLGNSKIITGSDYRQRVYGDLKTVLINPKLRLDNFTVEMDESAENRNAAMSEFSSFLSSFGRQLNVKCVQLFAKNQEEVLTVLPYLKPRALETIYFCRYPFGPSTLSQLKIDKVVELEQWKKAKYLKSIVLFLDFKIERLLHFNEIRARIDSISKEDVIRLKNTILASADFESCCLKVKSDESFEEIIEIFGEEKLAIPGSASYINVVYKEHNTVSLTKSP